LHRLEERGLVSSVWRESESGRRRKYYRLREAGRRALDEQRRQWACVNGAILAALGEGGAHVGA
jgi:DNA-binding PadR family transcriptional regulator